nr:hypothetical protein [Tanacetum cinerariifolium]
MPELEDISIFEEPNEGVFGAEADLNKLQFTFQVSPILTTRIYKDHPLKQVIRDLHLAPQTRKMTKSVTEHGIFSSVQQRINHKDFHNYLPYDKRAIGTKWVYKNKKDERGIVVRNKARLVAQGHTPEEGIDYDEVFAPVARIEELRLFLTYASFKDFVIYQISVKSAFLYVSTPMETSKPLLKDENAEDVDVHLYRLMIGSFMYLTSSRPDIMYVVCACARFQITPKVLHLYVMKRIF